MSIYSSADDKYMLSCTHCPRSKVVKNRKLECDAVDCYEQHIDFWRDECARLEKYFLKRNMCPKCFLLLDAEKYCEMCGYQGEV